MFFCGSTTLVEPVLPSAEVSRSHTGITHSVGILWTSYRPVAETSTCENRTQETDIHSLEGFEPAIPTGERPQTHALDRAVTGSAFICLYTNTFTAKEAAV